MYWKMILIILHYLLKNLVSGSESRSFRLLKKVHGKNFTHSIQDSKFQSWNGSWYLENFRSSSLIHLQDNLFFSKTRFLGHITVQKPSCHRFHNILIASRVLCYLKVSFRAAASNRFTCPCCRPTPKIFPRPIFAVLL